MAFSLKIGLSWFVHCDPPFGGWADMGRCVLRGKCRAPGKARMRLRFATPENNGGGRHAGKIA